MTSTSTPRHLADATADTGESARRETFHGMTTYPRHATRTA